MNKKTLFLIILSSALILNGCKLSQNNQLNNSLPAETTNNQTGESLSMTAKTIFTPPLSRSVERITKKPFGIKISPQDSPVQPENFSGYHTGTDFEILAGEENKNVPINTICDGTIKVKKQASGYGGVVVQECLWQDQNITVVYGHLNINSVDAVSNQYLSSGQFIGNLGQGFSEETDGERKHLHLSIHKGSQIDIRGYVQNQIELNNWLNYTDYLN